MTRQVQGIKRWTKRVEEEDVTTFVGVKGQYPVWAETRYVVEVILLGSE